MDFRWILDSDGFFFVSVKMEIQQKGYKVSISMDYNPNVLFSVFVIIGIHYELKLFHLLQMDFHTRSEKKEATFQMDSVLMDFGSKSIRTESITEKNETTFQMDSVLMDFRGKSIRTESIYGKQIKKETSPILIQHRVPRHSNLNPYNFFNSEKKKNPRP